jgi:hypothetical protein
MATDGTVASQQALNSTQENKLDRQKKEKIPQLNYTAKQCLNIKVREI